MTMKVSTTNDNSRNAIARNLMVPIPFYPKVDSSSGPNDKKSSELDCDATIHEVHYDPMSCGSYGDCHFGISVCVTCDINQNSQKSK